MSSPALNQQTPSPSRVPAPGPHIWIFTLVVWTMLGLLSAAQRAAFNV